jgi:hypothetical protein
MSQEQTEKLETWWEALSPDERGGVVQLEQGEPVPTELQEGLAEALGLGPDATEDEQGHFPLRVGEEVARFLAAKRESFGGWTV